jgi:hypothetical protein
VVVAVVKKGRKGERKGAGMGLWTTDEARTSTKKADSTDSLAWEWAETDWDGGSGGFLGFLSASNLEKGERKGYCARDTPWPPQFPSRRLDRLGTLVVMVNTALVYFSLFFHVLVVFLSSSVADGATTAQPAAMAERRRGDGRGRGWAASSVMSPRSVASLSLPPPPNRALPDPAVP